MQVCVFQTSGMNEFLSKFDDKVIYFDCRRDNRKHGPCLVYDTKNRLLGQCLVYRFAHAPLGSAKPDATRN